MKTLTAIIAGFTCFAAGCSAPGPVDQASSSRAASSRVIPYSQAENRALTYCVGLTDTAWTIADRKLHGAQRAEVEAYYSAKSPNPKLAAATIDKVYSASFTSAWDFGVGFFHECALNMGQISKERSQFGAYCMQNAMLASVAQQYRDNGASKEAAYSALPIKGKTPESVVDAVYAGQKTHASAMMDAWNTCIKPITAGS